MVTRLVLISMLLLMTACMSNRQVTSTEQYHEKETPPESTKALNGLQKQALKLMNQQQYDASIAYLQRAIKIEPRNPLNWHYMAQNYWHMKEFAKCNSMVQRAQSYIEYQPDLHQANQTLKQQCN